jgi:hypothetical protein
MSIQTPLGILGLALGICGVIAGANIIVEQFFNDKLFSAFLKAIPVFLQSFFPNDATILWFTVRANRNIYDSWDVALIYFVLVPLLFALLTGCWVFLILALVGVINIGTIWLIIWFVLTAINYGWSASNQYALEIKSHDRRLGVEGIKNRMRSDPAKTAKRWSHYFFADWVVAPFVALRIFFIEFLFVLLLWPAWLLRLIPDFRFDLTSRKTRRYYYAGYSAVFVIAGLVLASLH